MSKLGFAYISMTSAQAEALLTSGSGLVSDTLDTDEGVLDGFHFGTDVNAVANGHAGYQVVLRVDLDNVLDLVDVLEVEHPSHIGYDRFALGAEPFSISPIMIDFMDGAMLSFAPLHTFFDDRSNDNGYGVEIEEENDGDILGTGEGEFIEAELKDVESEEDLPLNDHDDLLDTDTVALDINPTEDQIIASFEVPAAEAPAADAPAKKVYDTPYLPRGQYFKRLREQGLLQPRQPKVKAANTDTPAKRVRSEAEMKAIRGHYARKNGKAA